ncbi:MAG: hypothetical protein P1U69_01155 [Parvibaculaceae bacterium]|nr:hypothetical protein [Parvibaculaceae bacterium]
MPLPLRQGLTLGLLISSIALLSSLIPGGPIENRDFGHLGAILVLSFNMFLAGLILASTVAVVLIWKRSHFGGGLAFLCSVGFAGVYLLDLLQIFPTSPTPMSVALYYVEAIGLIAAGLLMAASQSLIVGKGHAEPLSDPTGSFNLSIPMMLMILTVSVGIIAFATISALGLESTLLLNR